MTNKTMFKVDREFMELAHTLFLRAGYETMAKNIRIKLSRHSPNRQIEQSASKIDIESAAKKLAECMDYPWQHMTDQGRQSMRDFAKLVIEAGSGVKP